MHRHGATASPDGGRIGRHGMPEEWRHFWCGHVRGRLQHVVEYGREAGCGGGRGAQHGGSSSYSPRGEMENSRVDISGLQVQFKRMGDLHGRREIRRRLQRHGLGLSGFGRVDDGLRQAAREHERTDGGGCESDSSHPPGLEDKDEDELRRHPAKSGWRRRPVEARRSFGRPCLCARGGERGNGAHGEADVHGSRVRESRGEVGVREEEARRGVELRRGLLSNR